MRAVRRPCMAVHTVRLPTDWGSSMQHEQRRRLLVFKTRACTCGMRWPCPDALPWQSESGNAPEPDAPEWPSRRSPDWNTGTTAFDQIGRAGHLTRGQARRANGRRP